MSSNSKKPFPARPTPLSEAARPPRLDGDRLYFWAQIVERTTQAIQNKQAVAAQLITEMGLETGEHLLSDDGYVVTKTEFERAGRVRSVPAAGQTFQPELPGFPDSES